MIHVNTRAHSLRCSSIALGPAGIAASGRKKLDSVTRRTVGVQVRHNWASAAAKGFFREFFDGLVERQKLLLFGSESANGDSLVIDFALADGE